LKKTLCIILLITTLISAFSLTISADDNATSGDGDTQGMVSGYGWYNTYQYLWKVTLYVGKSDQATKASSLTHDFHCLGTIIMKKTGWTVSSSVKFGSGTKVDYYNGATLSMNSTPKIISDASCPAVPIACDGNINTVKAYFGSTGTLTTVLNAIAENNGTTASAMLSSRVFTIGGTTKSGWDYSYVAPNGTSNRVPWVIVYEPMVIMNLKDRVTKLAFTATEFALCEIYGWYDWNYGNGEGQNVGLLTDCHLPTSVQLEESWFGYPVYDVTDDSKVWSHEDIVKGGGWGMRWLSAAIIEPTAQTIDFACSIAGVATPTINTFGTVTVNWTNYSAQANTVLCQFYMGSTCLWSGYKTIGAGETISSTYDVYYSDTTTLIAQVNYENRYDETNPNNNFATTTVYPTAATNPSAPAIDYGVWFDYVEQPMANSYGLITVIWKNWQNTTGTVLCEVYLHGTCLYSGYKTLGPYETITQSFSAYYSGTTAKTLLATINYASANSETDPNDNLAILTVTPTQQISTTYDFSVSNISVFPSPTYQGYYCTVNFISDNWNPDMAYSNILVELLVDETVVKSELVYFSPFGQNNHSYSIYLDTQGTHTITARINWDSRYYESNSYNNSTATSVLVEPYYEFSVSNLEVTPAVVYEEDYIEINFVTDNWDMSNAYTNIPVEILYNDTVIMTNYMSYAAFGACIHSAVINVGTITGTNTISVRINWPNHYSEVDPNNNQTETVYITVKPKIDLSVEAISPNSEYREGMDVVTSFNIYNNSRHHIVPSHNNTVSFEAYYLNGTKKVTIEKQEWSKAVIPAWDKNLVYFKWTIPEALEGKVIYCKATVNSDHSIDEYDTTNNFDIIEMTIAPAVSSQTPDTQYEKQKPNGYTIPKTPTEKEGTATWSIWEYINERFVKKTYGISISKTKPEIRPDTNCPSAECVNGIWKMKSGYGITMSYLPTITNYLGYNMPDREEYTSVQAVYSTFPEFEFSKSINNFRVLEKVNNNWCFEKNKYADNNARLHFTPLWYPNGGYTVSVTASEVWTPAGMIECIVSSNAITIVDAAYDDWYVGRG